MQLKLYIKDELERRLTEMPALYFDGTIGNEESVRIATLTFAFHNS